MISIYGRDKIFQYWSLIVLLKMSFYCFQFTDEGNHDGGVLTCNQIVNLVSCIFNQLDSMHYCNHVLCYHDNTIKWWLYSDWYLQYQVSSIFRFFSLLSRNFTHFKHTAYHGESIIHVRCWNCTGKCLFLCCLWKLSICFVCLLLEENIVFFIFQSR